MSLSVLTVWQVAVLAQGKPGAELLEDGLLDTGTSLLNPGSQARYPFIAMGPSQGVVRMCWMVRCTSHVQVAVLGQGKPGAKLKLLVQALTSPSFAGREASQPAELIPEDLQVRKHDRQSRYISILDGAGSIAELMATDLQAIVSMSCHVMSCHVMSWHAGTAAYTSHGASVNV